MTGLTGVGGDESKDDGCGKKRGRGDGERREEEGCEGPGGKRRGWTEVVKGVCNKGSNVEGGDKMRRGNLG